MLELIQNYEQARFQLKQRIQELNAVLQNTPLSHAEREKLTSRRDTLIKERAELLEMILEMKLHLEKEESIYEESPYPCSGICA